MSGSKPPSSAAGAQVHEAVAGAGLRRRPDRPGAGARAATRARLGERMVRREHDRAPARQQRRARTRSAKHRARIALVLVAHHRVEVAEPQRGHRLLDLDLGGLQAHVRVVARDTAAMAGATSWRKADWNAATRTRPGRPARDERGEVGLGGLDAVEQRGGVRDEQPPGVGQPQRRGRTRSSSGAPASRSSTASCWETALGV